MNIEYITCSGIYEGNAIEDIIYISKIYTRIEFAVQVSREKFYQRSERYEFFRALVAACTMNDVNLAMHINLEYRTDLCRGILPDILRELWDIKRCKGTQHAGNPVVGRVQININGGKDTFRFNARKLADIIRAYPDIKFILQYAPTQRKRVCKLDEQGVPFSLLYDTSCGRGESGRDSWGKIILPNHQVGYAGGLNPYNIDENLDYIYTLLPNGSTWVDAESGLKDPEIKKFSMALAEQYVKHVYMYENKHACQKGVA